MVQGLLIFDNVEVHYRETHRVHHADGETTHYFIYTSNMVERDFTREIIMPKDSEIGDLATKIVEGIPCGFFETEESRDEKLGIKISQRAQGITWQG